MYYSMYHFYSYLLLVIIKVKYLSNTWSNSKSFFKFNYKEEIDTCSNTLCYTLSMPPASSSLLLSFILKNTIKDLSNS